MSNEKTEREISIEADIAKLKSRYELITAERDSVKADIEAKRRDLREEWNRKASEQQAVWTKGEPEAKPKRKARKRKV